MGASAGWTVVAEHIYSIFELRFFFVSCRIVSFDTTLSALLSFILLSNIGHIFRNSSDVSALCIATR